MTELLSKALVGLVIVLAVAFLLYRAGRELHRRGWITFTPLARIRGAFRWTAGWGVVKWVISLAVGAFILVFLLGLIGEIALLPIAYALRVAPARTDILDKEAEANFMSDALRAKYGVAGPFLHGWQEGARTARLEYTFPKDLKEARGPLVYTGLNCALTDDVVIHSSHREEFSALVSVVSNDAEGQRCWIPTGNPGSLFNVPLRNPEGLYVQGEAWSAGKGPFWLTISYDEPQGKYARISTRAQFTPGEVKSWGLLPDPDQYYWILYLRIADLDGMPYAETDMTTARSGYQMIFPNGTDAGRPVFQERTLDTSHRMDDMHGEAGLSIRAPDIPGGSLVEVILRIEPKRWEPNS